jgi:hypothetical protein
MNASQGARGVVRDFMEDFLAASERLGGFLREPED